MPVYRTTRDLSFTFQRLHKVRVKAGTRVALIPGGGGAPYFAAPPAMKPKYLGPLVFVAIYTHVEPYLRAFSTREAAEAWRREIAAGNWPEAFTEDAPADPKALADKYFERISERRDESFTVDGCYVEHADNASPGALAELRAEMERIEAAIEAGDGSPRPPDGDDYNDLCGAVAWFLDNASPGDAALQRVAEALRKAVDVIAGHQRDGCPAGVVAVPSIIRDTLTAAEAALAATPVEAMEPTRGNGELVAFVFAYEGSPAFDGFDLGTKWNGFDNVAITPEVRDEIVRRLADPRDDVADIAALPVENGRVSLANGFATRILR